MIRSKTSGFTLVEMLIVFAIIAILAVLIINPFTNFRNNQVLNGTAEEILAALQQARVKTLASDGGNQYGVHFASSQVTIFAGSTYNPSSPTNQNIGLNSAVTISGISLADAGSDVIFQKLTGITSQNGTIIIRLNSDVTKTKTITINNNGISDVN